MANIHNSRARLANLALSRLGKQLFVVGVEYLAIIADDEFEDETGLRRELTASFSYEASERIKAGDSVFYDGLTYVIGKNQRTNTVDPFYTVELKHA